MTAPARVVHGKPYLYRGSEKLLDINAAIMAARTEETQAATEGHHRHFSWAEHRIRLRDRSADSP